MENETNSAIKLPIVDGEKDLKFYKNIMVSGLITFFIGMSIVMAMNGDNHTVFYMYYTNIGKFIATIGLGIFTIGQLKFAYSNSPIELKLKIASLVISGIIIILLVYSLLDTYGHHW